MKVRNPSPRLLTLAVACWAGFAVLALAVALGITQAADRASMLALRTGAELVPVGPGWLHGVFASATHLGDGPVRLKFVLASAVIVALRRRWIDLLFLALSVVPANAINAAMKGLFARPRPDFLPHLDPAGGYAFPSGHAFGAATAYLAIAMALGMLTTQAWIRAALLALAIAVSALVGFSRVWLGVHYPSDVIAGMLSGSGWVVLVRIACDRLPITPDHPR